MRTGITRVWCLGGWAPGLLFKVTMFSNDREIDHIFIWAYINIIYYRHHHHYYYHLNWFDTILATMLVWSSLDPSCGWGACSGALRGSGLRGADGDLPVPQPDLRVVDGLGGRRVEARVPVGLQQKYSSAKLSTMELQTNLREGDSRHYANQPSRLIWPLRHGPNSNSCLA